MHFLTLPLVGADAADLFFFTFCSIGCGFVTGFSVSILTFGLTSFFGLLMFGLTTFFGLLMFGLTTFFRLLQVCADGLLC